MGNLHQKELKKKIDNQIKWMILAVILMVIIPPLVVLVFILSER